MDNLDEFAAILYENLPVYMRTQMPSYQYHKWKANWKKDLPDMLERIRAGKPSPTPPVDNALPGCVVYPRAHQGDST